MPFSSFRLQFSTALSVSIGRLYLSFSNNGTLFRLPTLPAVSMHKSSHGRHGPTLWDSDDLVLIVMSFLTLRQRLQLSVRCIPSPTAISVRLLPLVHQAVCRGCHRICATHPPSSFDLASKDQQPPSSSSGHCAVYWSGFLNF